MGARLWSQRRSARATPASHHAHTIITPTTFTHSDKVPAATDLGRVASVRRYHTPSRPRPTDRSPQPSHTSTTKKKKKKVKEGSKDLWNKQAEQQQQQQQSLHSAPNPVLVMSMEAARDRATLQRSVQQDTRLGFPHQVPRSDGEELDPQQKYPIMAEHDETKREYIKPAGNKTVHDVGNEATHRHYPFVGVFPHQGECGVGQCGTLTHHHQHHPTSSSSSSSSLSQPGYRDEGSSSPRRHRRNQLGANFVRTSLMPQCRGPFSQNKYYHDSSQKGGWSHGGLGMNTSPLHDPSNTLSYPSASNTLADITTMSVDCGPTHLSPGDRHAGVPADPQVMRVEGLGVQQRGDPHRYRQFTESPCSPTAESDDPPYSDVIDNSRLYNASVSRPSEQRTKSGKI